MADRAVTCNATMLGVRFTALELWDFVKATETFVEDGTEKPGIAGVSENNVAHTEFCDTLLAVKPDIDNSPLPLHLVAGGLDVVFTKHAAYVGRILLLRCGDPEIPPELLLPDDPTDPPRTFLPGGRDPQLDVDLYNRKVAFLEEFSRGDECCPDPVSAPVPVSELLCSELDFVVARIRDFSVELNEDTLVTVETFLSTRSHQTFQRIEIVRAINETGLGTVTNNRLAEALMAGEALSSEPNLIRIQLEQQGAFERPEAVDAAVLDAAAAMRRIGLLRTSPVEQISWVTLFKWAREEEEPEELSLGLSIKTPKTIGPEF